MKQKKRSDIEFTKAILKIIGGTLIIATLVVIGILWESIWIWFYHTLFPAAPRDTLLLFWLLFLFPTVMIATALVFEGGIKAYNLTYSAEEGK